MPYVNIKITKEGNVTPEQKARLISGVTGLLAEVLYKNPASTVVVIDEVPPGQLGTRRRPHSSGTGKNGKEIGNGIAA